MTKSNRTAATTLANNVAHIHEPENVGVMQISTTATKSDIINKIDMELAQLQAMTFSIYGGGQKSFNEMNDLQRDNYLWAIDSKVVLIRRLFDAHIGAK